MDIEPDDVRHARHERHAEHGRHRRQSARSRAAGPQARARRRGREAGAARLAATKLGVPVASLTRRARASSRAAARPSPTAQLIGDKLFNVHDGRRRASTPGAGAGEAGQPVQARRHRGGRGSTSRTRSPGTYTYVHNIRVPGMLHGRRRAAARPGRVRRRHRAERSSRSTRARSAHIPGVQGRPLRRLPRRRRAEGVRRDPGGGPAQGEVGRPADAPGQRQPLEADARPRHAPGRRRRGSRPARGNFDTRVRRRGEDGDRRPTSTTTTATCRSARPCAVADVTPDGARVIDRTRRTRYTMRDATCAAMLGAAAEQDPRRSTARARARSATRRPGTTAARRRRSLSQLAGAPVRLQFMRWDEHGWDNYGPAQLTDIRGGVDANGNIVAFEFTQLHAAGHLADGRRPDAAAGRRSRSARSDAGALDTTNTGAQYNIAEPARDRQDAAACDNVLQDVVRCGRRRPRRRASPRSR